MQETSKGSDQTGRMRRLIWGFAGHTYHIVGNHRSQLKCTLLNLFRFAKLHVTIQDLILTRFLLEIDL